MATVYQLHIGSVEPLTPNLSLVLPPLLLPVLNYLHNTDKIQSSHLGSPGEGILIYFRKLVIVHVELHSNVKVFSYFPLLERVNDVQIP